MGKKYIVRGDIPKEPALIIQEQPILTPGEYYGITLSEKDIREYIDLTDWNDPYITALIHGHKTNTSSKWLGNPSPEDWVGNYTKPVYKSTGVPKPGAYSDLKIYDSNLAAKVAYGNVKCGVSPAIELETKTFKNLSIVDNPKCKDAFLNLADEDSKVITLDPSFLNLSEDKTDIDERRLNDVNNMDDNKVKDIEERMKVFEESQKQNSENFKSLGEKVESLIKVIAEKPKEIPKEDPKVETPKPKEEDKKPSEDETKTEPNDKKKPVIIESPKTDNSEIVDAINKMGDKVSQEVGKVANPQTVAQTSPNANNDSDMDDEVTKQLVGQYENLHPEIKEE